MSDLEIILLFAGFGLLTWGLLVLCERLRGGQP